VIDFPANPTVGQKHTTGGITWEWDGVKWTLAGNSPINIGDEPPPNPVSGALWWDTVSANLFIWYDDGDTAQWVVAVNIGTAGAQGIQGIQGIQGEEGPIGPQGVIGPQGPIGLTGPQGPLGGTFADAPSDDTIYARRNALWVPSPGMAPGGRLTFNQLDPRPSNFEGASTIYYVPYLHAYVSVPASSSTVITMQIPLTGVVNSYSDATTNPAAVPAAAVHFGLFLWNNNGVLTLTRSPAVSCATGGAISPACPLAFGPNNMVVNSADIANGPAAKMGLYVGVAFTYSNGFSYMRTGGVSGGNFFGLANTYNRLAANTQIDYAVNSGVNNRSTASVFYAAIANTGLNDFQRFSASWGFSGAGIGIGAYSGTFLRAGQGNVVQTPFFDWYTISQQTQGTSIAATVTGAPNLQPGCWTFYLGASDAAFTTISGWGRTSTDFSLEI
jgi:hypothetical protein